MTDTEHLYKQSDDARHELTILDRHVAEAKEACREAIERLVGDLRYTYGYGNRLRVRDVDGRCYTAILEAIDDMVADRRDAIRLRLEEADAEIGDIEERDLRRSSPVTI